QNRAKVDADVARLQEEADYADTQAEEDAARAHIQSEAAARYEQFVTGRRGAPSVEDAFEQAERRQAATRRAQEDEAYFQREMQLGEQAQRSEIVERPTLAEVAPAPLREGKAPPATIRQKREARRLALPAPQSEPVTVSPE